MTQASSALVKRLNVVNAMITPTANRLVLSLAKGLGGLVQRDVDQPFELTLARSPPGVQKSHIQNQKVGNPMENDIRNKKYICMNSFDKPINFPAFLILNMYIFNTR